MYSTSMSSMYSNHLIYFLFPFCFFLPPCSFSQALQVMKRFKLHTLVIVSMLFDLHIVTFAILYVLVTGIQESIIDHNSSGMRRRLGKVQGSCSMY